jgi:hypothetical protein
MVEPLHQLERFKVIRQQFAKTCDVPADLASSSGLCHFYYFPTTQPGQVYWWRHVKGRPTRATAYYILDKKPANIKSTPGQTETISLDQAKEKIAKKIERMKMYATELDDNNRVRWYENMLAETELAPLGQRHSAITRLVHSLVYSFPELTDEQIATLIWPSVEAFTQEDIDAGRRRYYPSDVQKMIRGSRAKYAAEGAR